MVLQEKGGNPSHSTHKHKIIIQDMGGHPFSPSSSVPTLFFFLISSDCSSPGTPSSSMASSPPTKTQLSFTAYVPFTLLSFLPSIILQMIFWNTYHFWSRLDELSNNHKLLELLNDFKYVLLTKKKMLIITFLSLWKFSLTFYSTSNGEFWMGGSKLQTGNIFSL